MNEERTNEETGLGDLNRELLRERGENFPVEKPDFGQSGIADTIRPPGIEKNAPVGSPEIGASVRSVFDTRPVNANDFLEVLRGTVSNDGENFGPYEGTFTVPESRIYVIRSFRYSLEPVNIDPDRQSEVIFNIRVNGIFQPGYSNLLLGFGGGAEFPCHIIAPSNAVITFSLFFTAPGDWTVTDYYPLFVVHGNSLLGTGKPPEFEIGNENKTGKIIKSPISTGPVKRQFPRLKKR